MFNKRAEIDNLKLKVHKLKLDVSDRDREISRLNSGIKEMSKYYSERRSKPYVSADMVTNIKPATSELVKPINELKDALCGTTDQPKIYEIPEWQQARNVYVHSHMGYYDVYIDDPETVALLNEPNTRLAIIEDDEDA